MYVNVALETKAEYLLVMISLELSINNLIRDPTLVIQNRAKSSHKACY